MVAEAYVALTGRYETTLLSYAARMLGGVRDGERCLVTALAAGWSELEGGGAEPARPQEWFTAHVRERCFDELALRGTTSAEHDLDGTGDCVAVAADQALAALRPALRDLLLLRDVHGFDVAVLCAVTDMSEADAESQLYRARSEFASAYSELPAPEHCPARRRDCPDCAERERLRAQPRHALLHLGPLAVRDQVRDALRAAVSAASPRG
jgi:DNA-directed RNA polymerase specialized sigma24 family protein